MTKPVTAPRAAPARRWVGHNSAPGIPPNAKPGLPSNSAIAIRLIGSFRMPMSDTGGSALLPSTPMPRRAAAGAGGGAEFGAGLARVGWLEDFAAGARALVARRFARVRAAGPIGQGFRAVHFVEMGFVDFGGGGGTARGAPLTPTLSPRRAGRGGRRTAALFQRGCRQIRGIAVLPGAGIGAGLGLYRALFDGGIVDHGHFGGAQAFD